MSYIGNSLTQQSFTGGVDQFNGNASNTAFGLTRTINTVYDVDVYVENVWQRPGVGYNVSANTITFTSAPSAGSNNVVVVYRNFTATSVVPIQGSVTTSSFAANAIPATLGYIPANKAGDTFTGAVIVNNAITTNTLTVSTNTATIGSAVYVVANGSVGVGTNTPGAGIKLDVQGGEIRAGRVDSSSEGGQVSLARSSDNATAWYMDVFGNTSTPSLRLVDVSAGAVSLAINSSGAVALRGAGSVSGVGITFPTTQVASSDANTLDDYEEGTWTPTWGGWTTAGTTTYSTAQAGRYIKIGRFVMLKVWLGGSCSGGSTDYFSVGNFPFTTAAAGVEESGGIVSYITGVDMGASGRGWWFYPAANSTRGLGGAITQTSITGANPNVSFNLYMTIVYMSAS